MPGHGGFVVRQLLCVALGGALGSSCRYLVGAWSPKGLLGTQVPTGTLVVNVVGALIIGWLAGGTTLPAPWRHVIVVGFLGGFTTFSAFSWDTTSLATGGHLRCALLNVGLTVSLTLVAAWAGARLRSGA